MATVPNRTIEFHVEPADRSVGIMAEGFSAWLTDGDAWCNLEHLGSDAIRESAFHWYSNETGDRVPPPSDSVFVECCLHAYAIAFYQAQTVAEEESS